MMLNILGLSGFILSTAATGIILPLYVYPGSDGNSWSTVDRAISAYPEVQWQVIINPDTGPGTNSSSPYPNDDYVGGIKELNKRGNARTLGYVDTAFGKRAMEDVKSDIDLYAAWANYSDADISMGGIFFDDVPSIFDFQDNPGTQSSNETYFQSITAYAYTTIQSGTSQIVCNSGNPGASSFFQYCNTMIEFENKYTTFNGQSTLSTISSDGASLNHSAIVLYNAPTTLSASNVNSVVGALSQKSVEFIGLTNDCCYNSVNETLLDLVASACNQTASTNDNAASILVVSKSGWALYVLSVIIIVLL